MVNITSVLVKELRERTGAGMMECKKSLIETQGNIEWAIDNMRKSGRIMASRKSERLATEGIILIKVSENGKYGVIMELNCESDFVLKDSGFKAFGDDVIATALEEQIIDLGVLKAKFEEQRIALVAKIGENINIRRFNVLKGDVLGVYLHGHQIGVMVSAIGADEKLVKQLAMHIAASKPAYLNADDVSSDVLAREYHIQLEIALKSGKSCDITEKMVKGRMRKFINEISLTGQDFVMDPSKTVAQVLDEHNAMVNKFIRFEMGEGIKKNKVDFSSEVMEMSKRYNE